VAPGVSSEPVTSNERLPSIPDDLWDEMFQILEPLGRVYPIAAWPTS
jgi:hypothetical protein